MNESIHDEAVRRVVDLAATAKLGDPHDPGTQVGPITTRPQLRKVLDYIGIAKEEGARVVLGGAPANPAEVGDGWFVQPTIVTGVAKKMRIAQ